MCEGTGKSSYTSGCTADIVYVVGCGHLGLGLHVFLVWYIRGHEVAEDFQVEYCISSIQAEQLRYHPGVRGSRKETLRV